MRECDTRAAQTAARLEPSGGHPWFEVQTAALADFPHQARVVEIYDQDNGWVMVRGTAFDFMQDDPIAEEGRRRGVAD